MFQKPYIIGICGGSGSGKTHFLSELKKQFSNEAICIISQDEYYKKKEAQMIDDKGVHNFDLPQAIDTKKLLGDIYKLKKGETATQLEYTFNNPDLTPKLITYSPAPIILVEGIFIFHYEEIFDLLDFSIFIHTKKEIKLERRIKRDAEVRGYPIEHVLYTDENHVKPAYQKFIKPFRHEADIVIPNNENGFEKALNLVQLLIKTKLPQ